MKPEVPDNGKAGDLSVIEITIEWAGKTCKVNSTNVLKAFESADFGDLSGPYARYVLDIDGELKTAEAVFSKIVPIEREDVSVETLRRIADLFESLGFDVLDRDKHHGK